MGQAGALHLSSVFVIKYIYNRKIQVQDNSDYRKQSWFHFNSAIKLKCFIKKTKNILMVLKRYGKINESFQSFTFGSFSYYYLL